MRRAAICLVLALTGCATASPENTPHQNTVVKMGGESHIPAAPDLSWVHSASLLHGTTGFGSDRQDFSVHVDGTGLKLNASPTASVSPSASENGQASRHYMFADGATAYLDSKSNLVVSLTNGHIIIVEPSVTFYFPWAPPPPPSSGVACDCGMPGGVRVIPYIQGIVDGNFLIYRVGPDQETWIFGLKEVRKSRFNIPPGYFLNDIGGD